MLLLLLLHKSLLYVRTDTASAPSLWELGEVDIADATAVALGYGGSRIEVRRAGRETASRAGVSVGAPMAVHTVEPTVGRLGILRRFGRRWRSGGLDGRRGHQNELL